MTGESTTQMRQQPGPGDSGNEEQSWYYTQGCLTPDLSGNLVNSLTVGALLSRARKGHPLCSLLSTHAISFLGQWTQDEFVSFSWLNLLASLCLHTYICQLPGILFPVPGITSLFKEPGTRQNCSLFLILQCYLFKHDFSSLSTPGAQIRQLARTVFQ